jgi:hypothetical protein
MLIKWQNYVLSVAYQNRGRGDARFTQWVRSKLVEVQLERGTRKRNVALMCGAGEEPWRCCCYCGVSS